MTIPLKILSEILGFQINSPKHDFRQVAVYENARVFHHPETVSSQIPCAVIAIDTEFKNVIGDSNGYFSWWTSTLSYNSPALDTSLSAIGNFMKEGVERINSPLEEVIKIDSPVFFLSNAYTGWNFGHDLSTMLFAIRSYKELKKLYREIDIPLLVSSERLALSENTSDLIKLMLPNSPLIEVPAGKIFECKTLFMPSNCYFHLHTQNGFVLTQDLKNIILKSTHNRNLSESDFGKNLILCKLETHQATRPSGIFEYWAINRLKNSSFNFEVLDPEKISFTNIISLLSVANRVILGSGGIQYAHRNFITPDADVFFLFDGPNYDSPLNDFSTYYLNIPESNQLHNHASYDALFKLLGI